MRRREWTSTEDDAVRRLYPEGGTAAVQAEIPHRGATEIYAYAKRKGVKRRPRVDTSEMEAEMMRLYREGGTAAVRARFPATEKMALSQWAHRHGVKREFDMKKRRIVGRPFKPRPTLLKRSFGEMRQSAVLRQWYRPEKTGPLVATIGRAYGC